MNAYPDETLDEDEDDGTMPESRRALADAVVGHKIVSAKKDEVQGAYSWRVEDGLVLTLDNGKQVTLYGESDCCAFTEVSAFLLRPESVDHIITGVGTTEKYTEWHIYADYGDILNLTVGWSCGNPFYYGYGFTVRVVDPSAEDVPS